MSSESEANGQCKGDTGVAGRARMGSESDGDNEASRIVEDGEMEGYLGYGILFFVQCIRVELGLSEVGRRGFS